jgi:hypothetical protein
MRGAERRADQDPVGEEAPAAECTLVTVINSSEVRAGNRPGRRSANMVLPEPGVAHHQEVVASGGVRLEDVAPQGLSPDIGQILGLHGYQVLGTETREWDRTDRLVFRLLLRQWPSCSL